MVQHRCSGARGNFAHPPPWRGELAGSYRSTKLEYQTRNRCRKAGRKILVTDRWWWRRRRSFICAKAEDELSCSMLQYAIFYAATCHASCSFARSSTSSGSRDQNDVAKQNGYSASDRGVIVIVREIGIPDIDQAGCMIKLEIGRLPFIVVSVRGRGAGIWIPVLTKLT